MHAVMSCACVQLPQQRNTEGCGVLQEANSLTVSCCGPLEALSLLHYVLL